MHRNKEKIMFTNAIYYCIALFQPQRKLCFLLKCCNIFEWFLLLRLFLSHTDRDNIEKILSNRSKQREWLYEFKMHSMRRNRSIYLSITHIHRLCTQTKTKTKTRAYENNLCSNTKQRQASS